MEFKSHSVGVDFVGLYYVPNRKGRGTRVTKCYLFIYVCLRYKCVYLEAVSDISKDAFIITLTRFVSPVGASLLIYFSDNNHKFVAAAKEMGNI